jgi:hypothetical protein
MKAELHLKLEGPSAKSVALKILDKAWHIAPVHYNPLKNFLTRSIPRSISFSEVA